MLCGIEFFGIERCEIELYGTEGEIWRELDAVALIVYP